MKMLVLQHNDVEGPGMIANWANANDYQVDVLRPDQGDNVAAVRTDQFDLLVLMGGGNSVADSDLWIAAERDLIRRTYAVELPIFGVCLGAQQIAVAFGGMVENTVAPEVGWWPVQAAPQAPLALPDSMVVLHWHGQQVTLPAGGQRLFQNQVTLNQGFALGSSVIGLQFHLEMDAPAVKAMTQFDQDFLAATDAPNQIQQTPDELNAHPVDAQNQRVLNQLLDSITK